MRFFLAVFLMLMFVACSEREGGHMRAAVPELSGLVKSHTHPGVFWGHSDSGNEPELWAIDGMGRTLARYTVDVENNDWEDIAADPEGNLYIGDIGDNFGLRDELQILRVAEPKQLSTRGELKVSAVQRFHYPKGKNGKAKRYDSEAIFFTAGRLYLLSKDRMSTVSTLYRFPLANNAKTQTLELVTNIDLRVTKSQGAAPVTAADVSRDGTRVALTSYKHLYVFRFDGETLRERVHLSKLPKGDGLEALAFDGARLIAGREDGTLIPLLLPLHAQPGQE